MHVVLFDTLDTNRLEGAGTDVQGDEGRLDALGRDGLQQRLVEMQPGRGRRNGTGMACIDSLVALAIGILIRPVYIRRQWHVPEAIEQGQHLFGEAQLEQRIVPREHGRLGATVDEEDRTRLGRLARTHMGEHAVAVQHALHEDFQLAA